MGYNTYFSGKLAFNKPLDKRLNDFLDSFFKTRHFVYSKNKILEVLNTHGISMSKVIPPGFTDCGEHGEFLMDNAFTHLTDRNGNLVTFEDCFDDLMDFNLTPKIIPSLWCDFEITDKGEKILFVDGKNYGYVKWINFLIENFFFPAGYILNGEVEYQGENEDDKGKIVCENNKIDVICYDDDDDDDDDDDT